MAVRLMLSAGFCFFSALALAGTFRSALVPLGSAWFEVRYDPGMKLQTRVEHDQAGITGFYHLLLDTGYATLLEDLDRKKDSLLLNDWMYYCFLRSSVTVIFHDRPDFEKELIAWFLLSHAGFDTRLAYHERRAFLYVHVEEEVFELPMIEDNKRNYFHIPYPLEYPLATEEVILLPFTAMPGGKPLSFKWQGYPLLPAAPVEKRVQLRTRDTLFHIAVTYDRAMVDMLAQQPILGEFSYFEAPVSPFLKASLLPQLAAFIDGKSEVEAIETLLAFTRSSFEYREDEAYFGRSKPMIPDEIFFYEYSDCEDRAALFFLLVKELTGLPMIVVSFADHVTIGVATEQVCEASVQYAGRRYCICDPTGPVDNQQAGVWPKGYEKQGYQIAGVWP